MSAADEQPVATMAVFTPDRSGVNAEMIINAAHRSCQEKVYQTGSASWYGPGFHGRKTANGERFNQDAMTAAHRKLPLGTRIKVENLGNGKTVNLRINDRGPYAGGRILDVSKGAAGKLGMLKSGTAQVRISIISCP